MDYINRVELAGTVGACRLTQAGGQTVARMSVATTIVYRDSAGEQVLAFPDAKPFLQSGSPFVYCRGAYFHDKGDFIQTEFSLQQA